LASAVSTLATSAAVRAEPLMVAADPFFDDHRTQIVFSGSATVRHEFVREGGLISYGADVADAYRQVGIYTGRIQGREAS